MLKYLEVKISLIGLGKLGLPLLLTFAKNGQKIIGIDVDREKINTLRDNRIPFFEPKLDDYLKLGSENLELYDDFDNVINNTDVAIILVNTPSNELGEFSNEYVYNAVDELSTRLKDSNKEDFLFIISSTVMPGSHIDIIKRIENQSGRKLNKGFGLVYIPDLVALGSVIKDFENPDLIIMGEITNYGKDPDALMQFNPDKGCYEVTLLLKQGYYDYQYVLRTIQNGKLIYQSTFTEQDTWETENNYLVLVYFRSLGGRYDELIGIRQFNSQFNKEFR
jgi:UDP-N-acetyl-D-mannosaminuronate dehydrogenase